jgi:hypothetical protein
VKEEIRIGKIDESKTSIDTTEISRNTTHLEEVKEEVVKVKNIKSKTI